MTTYKKQMSDLFRQAWQMVKKNGYTMSKALKVAWLNLKLKNAMRLGIVRFYFQKVDGTIREAFGTLKSDLLPPTKGERKTSPTIQTYFDTERGENGEWRCFKVANLLAIE